MAKKLFILTVLAATMLSVAAPIAFAEGGREDVSGPQPVQWTGEETTLSGLLEPDGEKLDGTPVWRLEDQASGTLYHVEQGEGVDLVVFEGQIVSLHGSLGYLEGAVILVDSVEVSEEKFAVEAQQYEPAETTGEEFSGTGTVEYLDNKADGTPVYGLAVSPEEGHYIEGDFDFAAFEGEEVEVTGRILHRDQGGYYLHVQSIGLVSSGDGEVLPVAEETTPATSPEPFEHSLDGAEDAAPAASLTTTEDGTAEETVAVTLASEEITLASDAPNEPGVFSVAAKALPVTGGVALLVPLAGLVIAAAGHAVFRTSR